MTSLWEAAAAAEKAEVQGWEQLLPLLAAAHSSKDRAPGALIRLATLLRRHAEVAAEAIAARDAAWAASSEETAL